MDRLTKLALTAWMCAALAFQVWLLRDAWPELPWVALGTTAAFALAALFDRRVLAVVLSTAYVFPVIIFALRGVVAWDFDALWFAALFGVLLPDLLRTPWRIPRQWRAPLVYSGLVIAVAVTVVIVREVDGHPSLYAGRRLAFWPDTYWYAARWTMYVGVWSVLGLLFLDTLFVQSADVEATMAPALGASALVMATVAAYQRLVDPAFMNGTMFEKFGRATGTMYDANAMGMVAALWLAGVGLWAAASQEGWRRAAAVPALVLLSTAVWASGSRTAFAVAVAIGLCGGFSAVIRRGSPWWHTHRWQALVAVIGAVVVLAGVIGTGREARLAPRKDARHRRNNPVKRIGELLRNATPRTLAEELWRRNGYGEIATEIIRQWPVAGVGVGAFNGMSEDLSGIQLGHPIAPDNAQNWLRHQVAELGWLGALGWIVWVVLFTQVLCRPRVGQPPRIWVLRGALVAFGLISLVGMPAQNPMIAITFWVFVYWYSRLFAVPATPMPMGRWTWMGLVALVVLFAGASISAARTTLRPPVRARQLHVAFSYGFGPTLERAPQAGFRAINADAAMLVAPDGQWMTISLQRVSQAASSSPVEVRVWANGVVLLKARLERAGAFTSDVRLPVGERPMLLEARVRGEGGRWSLSQETDVLMNWSFGDVPHSGVRGYESARPR